LPGFLRRLAVIVLAGINLYLGFIAAQKGRSVPEKLRNEAKRNGAILSF
jgi:hypothetical protein